MAQAQQGVWIFPGANEALNAISVLFFTHLQMVIKVILVLAFCLAQISAVGRC